MAMPSTLRLETRGDRELVMTRVFNAPRHLVWECHTRPELLKQWLTGPPGWTMVVCEMDLRVGRAYRWVWRNESGIDMGMGGVHREIVPHERIVCTQLFDEDWTGGEAIGTLQFTEHDGKTTLTNTVRYASPEALQAVLQSGMEVGVSYGYDRLETLLGSGKVTTAHGI